MEDSTAQVILAAAVHQGLGEHFVRTTMILVSSSVHLQAHLRHTYSHTILFCSVYVRTCNCQPCESSYIHSFILNFSLLDVLPLPEQGAAASMVATIMPVTVFAKRAMEDRTAKLLLEKVIFFHVAPPLHVGGVCMCMCLWHACACVWSACVYLNQNTAIPWILLFSDCHCNYRGN